MPVNKVYKKKKITEISASLAFLASLLQPRRQFGTQLNNKCVFAQFNLVFVRIQQMKKEKKIMPLAGFISIYFNFEEDWYCTLTYSIISEYR